MSNSQIGLIVLVALVVLGRVSAMWRANPFGKKKGKTD